SEPLMWPVRAPARSPTSRDKQLQAVRAHWGWILRDYHWEDWSGIRTDGYGQYRARGSIRSSKLRPQMQKVMLFKRPPKARPSSIPADLYPPQISAQVADLTPKASGSTVITKSPTEADAGCCACLGLSFS